MALTWMPPRRKGPRMFAPSTCGGGMGAMGEVAALVVGAPPGMSRAALYRQGMAGMGGGTVSQFLDRALGGKVTAVSGQLADVERALKISTVASLVGAAVAVYSLFRRRGR